MLIVVGVVVGGAGALFVGAGLLDLDNPWVGIAFVYGIPTLAVGAALALVGWFIWRSATRARAET